MATSNGRVLGKGRTLGSSNNTSSNNDNSLAPPAIAQNGSQSNLPSVSPSESSLSVNSHLNGQDIDISSAAALQSTRNGRPSVESSRMVCPICNEQMVTLLQLNRHLDDTHKNLEVEEQDEVKTWFKSQVVRAKKFQPLAVLNQKLKGLDVFESNDEPQHTHAPTGGQRSSAQETNNAPRPMDADEVVTREHWQRYTSDGCCSDPMCGKRLGPMDGNINCRKCGKLFCEEHTMYQMKLSRSAQHEPVRGYWSRVCETCYKSRRGYNDTSGCEKDHMVEFTKTRRKAVDKSYLEVGKLEKRMTKLTHLLVDPSIEQDNTTVNYLWSLSGAKSQRRLLEETVVDWEDDATVPKCPFCQQEFSNYGFRRHHCRLCGRVVCADPSTGCSSEVALNVEAPSNNQAEKPSGTVPVDVRMCKDCKHTIFSKSDFSRDMSTPPQDQRAFQNLKQFEKGIRAMLPRFQKLLTTLQDPEQPPSQAQLSEATRVRRRLTDSFTQYDLAAKRLRDLPTSSPTQQKLQRQVQGQASTFLHIHMLPLKSLPKLLKHAAPSHSRSVSTDSVNGHLSPAPNSRGPLANIQRGVSPNGEESSQRSSMSRLSSLETEEKAAREQLIVLEEQKFMVEEMLANARRRRKIEESESLSKNLEDLTVECDRLQGVLSGLRSEVEGVWTTGNG